MKIGRGNQSTRRKPAPAPFCPPQIPLDQTRARTRAAAVGSQRLTAWYKAPIWGLRPDLYNSYDNYGFFFVRRPLWWEDGSDFYICCWPLPAQSFFGPTPLGLATILYCLTFETSLFVASYDSQGYGGGIRSRLQGRCCQIILLFN
jgi:hypothetical protein